MDKILCSTRGGEASILAQEAAIRRTKETGSKLIFFYVTDVEFLAFANYGMRQDVVANEMDKMAEFLMIMAVERAEKEGVQAEYLIRRGRLEDELKAVVREQGITLVVLGRPEGEESAFKLAGLRALADRIRLDTGVEVWIPETGEKNNTRRK